MAHPDFGKRCLFETGDPFPQTGINLAVIEPGQPNCRYHREAAQEDFLVLSGECLLLVNGEEKRLGAWDYVHCSLGVSHVFVGAGTAPRPLSPRTIRGWPMPTSRRVSRSMRRNGP